MTDLTLKDVSYIYGEGTPFRKVALDRVSLCFHADRITGLIGHTGSGKSTLAMLLNGLYRPNSGEILIGDQNIWENPKEISKIRFRVGLVFQYPEYQLFEETVYKDIAFGPTNMGVSGEELDRLVRSAAEFTGIEPAMLDKSPFELSGGQKRRVAIAGVLAMDPEVIVLDEPAAGLDPKGREEILGRLKHYQRKQHKTVVLISHSMEDMAHYSDDLVVMKNGKVLTSGSTGEVFSRLDDIRSAGLEAPQISKLAEKLIAAGIKIQPPIYTVEAAKEAILRAVSEKQEKL